MKKTMSIVGAFALAAGLGLGCKSNDKHTETETTAPPKVLEQRPADNTGTNERDRAVTETTADNAGQGKSDVDIMAQIRSAVVDDGALSTNAHNVKIVAERGIVTLKGPVANATEQAAVVAKATAVVGKDNVVDQLEIAP